MPIVSRQLDSVQISGDTVLASFLAIDVKGREWRRSRSRFADEAAAQAASDAHDWTLQLKKVDFANLLIWVQGQNTPGTFDFTNRDLALLEGEERLLVWFAGEEGVEAIKIAWWIESLNPPQFTAIRTRAGYDAATGSRIQDRAISLAACELTFDAVEKSPA